MSSVAPPIVRLAERLLVAIEQTVRRFARYHKYSVGADLRAQAMEVAVLAQRAWRNREHQQMWIARLSDAVDDLKLKLQLGSAIRAFPSFPQFEALSRLVKDLGKQVGGWRRQQKHPNGQSAASDSSLQSPMILSTRAASAGAKP